MWRIAEARRPSCGSGREFALLSPSRGEDRGEGAAAAGRPAAVEGYAPYGRRMRRGTHLLGVNLALVLFPIMRMNIAVAAVIVLLAAFMVRAGGLF